MRGKTLRFTVQAAVTQQDPGPNQRLLLGVGAPQWMQFAAQLSQHLDQVAWEVHALLRTLAKGDPRPTQEQAHAANEAAIALLRFGLEDPRYHGVVRVAIEVAADTMDCDAAATETALSQVLREQNLAEGAHEWLHPLAERLAIIARSKPDFAVRIVDVVFNTSGESEAAVPVGSRILPLSMNKRDLVRMARHDVVRAFGDVWKHDPITATRVVLRAVNATAADEQSGQGSVSDLQVPFRGGIATVRPDASYIWAVGEHNQHEDWFRILSAFRFQLADLANREDDAALLGAVLDVLRDEAEFAVIWVTLLEAAAAAPKTLGEAVSELLTSTALLALIDTQKAAGDLISKAFEFLSHKIRLEVETAILRMSSEAHAGPSEYTNHGRDRMLGCIPVQWVVSAETTRIRAELDAAGGPPVNEADFSISVERGGGNDDWLLRQQGVTPGKAANAPLLKLHEAVRAIPGPKPGEDFVAKDVVQHLDVLLKAEKAVRASGDADAPVVQQLDDEIIDACMRLARANGLERATPLLTFIRKTLRRAATSARPVHVETDDEQWDKDIPVWRSRLPRISAAQGLMWLAADTKTADPDTLTNIARLARDPVPAVRYQVLAHCRLLNETNPGLMWELIESTCATEPRTAILTHFCANVIRHVPLADFDRLEPHVRTLLRRARRNEKFLRVRGSCATFYARVALWRRDRRAIRYVSLFAGNPDTNAIEANTLVDDCRGLVRYSEAGTVDEGARVRRWAFDYLTQVVLAVRTQAERLREEHPNETIDRWPQKDIERMRQLHEIAHNVALKHYFGSGAAEERGEQPDGSEVPPTSIEEKQLLLTEGRELFDALCDIEFVESAYYVLQTLEFLVEVDHPGVIRRIAALVRRAERDGIQYESLAADLIVQIVERYLSEYRSLFRDDPQAREALLDILDIFVGAGWPEATRLTYRLGEVFR